MSHSPYRDAAERVQETAREAMPNVEVLPFLVVLWLASVIRVLGALVRDESFGTEPTLAVLVVVLGGFFGVSAARTWWRRRRLRSITSAR
jgi:hypothetical protein